MTQFDFTNSDVPVVLTIASSDSGAGSGIQADLKTFSVLDVFGTCAVTAVTAQSPTEVRSLYPVPPDIVMEQIQSVSDHFPISAAKTGLLPTRALVEMAAKADETCGFPSLVVDPRMMTARGTRMIEPDAVEAMKEILLPVARVVTPNVRESEILAGFPIGSVEDLEKAALTISQRYEIACVCTGGALNFPTVVDILCDEGVVTAFEHERVDVPETHGAGCTYSAALTAYLAKGELLTDAVKKSRELVSAALSHAWHVGPHFPLHLSVR
jgi:hydroxymethylpyrimidine/phosphomethylpyrimidine kinase